MSKNIISFSLWGNNPKYTIGAIKNAELCNKIYPGWISRFYYGLNTPDNIIKGLSKIENVELVNMNVIGNWSGMFWRFLPTSESDVSVMISRDCDSRLNQREKDAVDEWLNSDKSFHIMRDHPYHSTEILGGMWGCKYPKLKNMKDLIDEYVKGEFWQVDQNFLREKIWNIIKDDCLSHDEFFKYSGQEKPFPSKRNGNEFVGEAFDFNDQPNLNHRRLIK